jgi:hypothetical protein
LGEGCLMNNDENMSRPKVHRLPKNKVQEGELYVSRAVLIVCLALLLVAVIPALWSFRTVDKNKKVENITPAQAKMIAPTANAPVEVIPVQDDKGQMVGQLAKMPSDMEKGTSISSMSKVDPQSGKELMNIIGKY